MGTRWNEIILEPEELWKEFENGSTIHDRKSFERLIREIVGNDAAGRITVSLMVPGKSGAGVIFCSFLDDRNRQKHWVVKLISGESIELLQSEAFAVEDLVRRLYPSMELRKSLAGAIASSYVGSVENLAQRLSNTVAVDDAVALIRTLFASLSPWHDEVTPENRTFFQEHWIDANARAKVPEKLLAIWDRLAREHPVTRGFMKTICHGDLNPTNVLVGEDDSLFLIDFASTGYRHWAFDFVRLEREIRFKLLDDDIKAIATLNLKLDSTFIPSADPVHSQSRVARATAVIGAIRLEAKKAFLKHVSGKNEAKRQERLEEEYLQMLLFQELCLFASHHWLPKEEVREVLINSASALAVQLLKPIRSDYFFGYFYRVIDGYERILVELADRISWTFPICGFVPKSRSIDEAVNIAVNSLISSRPTHYKSFVNAGFGSPEIIKIERTLPGENFVFQHEGKERFINPYLVQQFPQPL